MTKSSVALAAGALWFVCLASAAAAQTGFAGSEACKTCHPDKWFGFYKNPHYKSVASGKERPDRTGCEGCHGAGEEHINAGGATSIPNAFSRLTPKQAIDVCLRCHGRDAERANIRRSDHTLASIACTRCHSIHHPASERYQLARPQTELCYSCHPSARADFALPVRHRVNEGVVACSDCHNPHGSFAASWKMAARPRMVRQAFDSEQPCLKCHMDKRGPFVYEHPPVRTEGCSSCHVAHGSANSRLLRRPVVFTLCLECHNGAAGFGSRGRGIPVEDSSHSMLDPRYQKCTSCHVRLHGSNSDQTFFR
jgi:DmsE family decaheme c-type cytochrome